MHVQYQVASMIITYCTPVHVSTVLHIYCIGALPVQEGGDRGGKHMDTNPMQQFEERGKIVKYFIYQLLRKLNIHGDNVKIWNRKSQATVSLNIAYNYLTVTRKNV